MDTATENSRPKYREPQKLELSFFQRMRIWFREHSVPRWIHVCLVLGVGGYCLYSYLINFSEQFDFFDRLGVWVLSGISFPCAVVAVVGYMYCLFLRDVNEDDD